MKQIRIFIGVVEVAGYYGNLAFALRERGYSVTVVGAASHVFEYKSNSNENPFIIRLYDKLLKASALKKLTNKRAISHQIKKKIFAFLTRLLKLVIFLWVTPNHDVFIFGFGSSFLPGNLDLPILKFINKKVICNIAHGSEARPPYINGAYVNNLSNPITKDELSLIKKLSKTTKRRCSTIEKYADIVIGAPLTSHFLEKPFINIFHLGLIFRELSADNTENDNQALNVRILHCPSNPTVKGTSLIRHVIKSLKNKGHKIDFIELINKPNSTVIEELNICDFVVDQAYSDFPLPGFATEAAWFAKPSVVGGYGWHALQQLIPDKVFPPSHICYPNDLETAVEKLIIDKEYRINLGNQAQNFVKSNWSIQKCTDRYLQLINGPIPEDWWSTPCQIPYLHGCGISESTLLEVFPQLLQAGEDILQIKDKPSLTKMFIKLCIPEPNK